MARIVTAHYRYKRPPREKKAAALETHAAPANDDQRSAVVTTRRRALLSGKMQKAAASLPSKGDKATIVTTRKPSKLRGESVSKDVPGAANGEEGRHRHQAAQVTRSWLPVPRRFIDAAQSSRVAPLQSSRMALHAAVAGFADRPPQEYRRRFRTEHAAANLTCTSSTAGPG